jgi:hypothetical protein
LREHGFALELRNTSDGGELTASDVGVSHARWIIYAVVGGLLLLWGLWWGIHAVLYVVRGEYIH